MYAELSLDHRVLKDIVEKAVKPAIRRALVDYSKLTHSISLRRACRVVGISDSVYRYQPNTQRDDEVIVGLQQVIEKYPAYGFLVSSTRY